MNQKYTFRKEFSRIFTCIHWQGELLNPLIELFYCDIFTIAPNIEINKIRFRHIDPDGHADTPEFLKFHYGSSETEM